MADVSIPIIIVLVIGLMFAILFLFNDAMIWYKVAEGKGYCIHEPKKDIAWAEFYSIVFALIVVILLTVYIIYSFVVL